MSQVCYQVISTGLDGCLTLWDLRVRGKTDQPGLSHCSSHRRIITLEGDKEKYEDFFHSQEHPLPIKLIHNDWRPFFRLTIPKHSQKRAARYLNSCLLMLEQHQYLAPVFHFTETGILIENKPKISDDNKTIIESSFSTDLYDGTSTLRCQLCMATQDGDVLLYSLKQETTDFNPKKKAQLEVFDAKPVQANYSKRFHESAVRSLSINPFDRSVILITSCWSWSVWSLSTLLHPISRGYVSRWNVCLTQGAWSQASPTIIYLLQDNGSVSIWDLSRCFSSPAKVAKVSDHPLRCISLLQMGKTQSLIGIGDAQGVTWIFEEGKRRSEATMMNGAGGYPHELKEDEEAYLTYMETTFWPRCQHERMKLSQEERYQQRMRKRELRRKAIREAKKQAASRGGAAVSVVTSKPPPSGEVLLKKLEADIPCVDDDEKEFDGKLLEKELKDYAQLEDKELDFARDEEFEEREILLDKMYQEAKRELVEGRQQ